MKTASTGFALFALAALPLLFSAPSAQATSFTCGGHGDHVQWSDRCDPGDARLAITSEDGQVMLLLTDREVVMQLSNRALHRVNRELRDAKREQDNWFASAIVTAVTSTVRELLDSSLTCDVSDLRDVSYEGGRLVLTGRNGRQVFGNVHINDTDVAEAFSERDARRFVREFHRVQAGR
jgi:hypothetical protein